MGFGAENNYTKDYIEYLKTRDIVITRWKNSNYKEEVFAAIEQNNVEVITNFGIDEIDQEKASVYYKQV